MSAAGAVKKALEELEPGVVTQVVDSFTKASAFFGKLAVKGYIQLVTLLPQVYNFIYDLHAREESNSQIKSRLTKSAVNKFRELIKKFAPDILVCTHAFPSGIASILKEEFHIPMVSIITDFTVHPFWIHPNTDLYLVGSTQLRSVLEKRGIPGKRIKVTGIPVDPRFCDTLTKEAARERLALKSGIPTLLLMGGGAGLGPIGKILRSLRKLRHPVQVIVVTGVNRGLRKRMEKIAIRVNKGRDRGNVSLKHVRIYGFVHNIHQLMCAADLLITKPGGLTSSEALAAEVPLLIVRPLPGQEIRNAQYLLKENAAVMVKQEKSLPKVVDELLDHPETLASLQKTARDLKKPRVV